MTITPDQAQEWLDWAIPGPWEASFDEVYCATRLYTLGEGDEIEDGDSWELARHAPDLAQTIAGMAEEWAVRVNGRIGRWGDRANADRELDACRKLRTSGTLIRRLVGPVEVAE